MLEKRWYVYFLCDEATPDMPFYIGKGTGNRCEHHERYLDNASDSNPAKKQVIRQILAQGRKVLKRKVAEFASELDAYIYEWAMVGVYHPYITNVMHGASPIRDAAPRSAKMTRNYPEEQMYSVQETAKLLSTSSSTVIRMIRDHDLDAAKIRDVWRIHRESLEKYLDP
jgi:excisionase family DNA binding protein